MDLFYKEVLRMARDAVLSWNGDEDVADEIAQEIAIDQWERRRVGRPHRVSPGKLGAYVAAAAWKRLAKHRRAGRRRNEAHHRYEEVRADAESFGSDLYGAMVAKDLVRAGRAALAAMTEERRETFLAVREEGLSYSEAAVRRGISPRTANNLIQKAARALRQAWLDQEG